MRRIPLPPTPSFRALSFNLRLRPPRGARTLALAGLLLAGAVTLSACSSSTHPAAEPTALAPGAGQSLAGQPGASGSPAPAATMSGMTMSAPPGTASQPPVAGNAVTIKNFAFAPAALVVAAGTTVTWTNQDSDDHTVTSRGSGGPLNSSPLNPGQTYSYTFTTPGTYNYMCTIHPFMVATVTVTP